MAVTVKGKGKHVSRARRHFRLRKKVAGTPERPRLVVSRSNRHMMAQIIDDSVGHTLVSASTLESGLRGLAGNKVDKSARAGSWSPSEPWKPGSRRSSSTAEATSTTVEWPLWQRAPAPPG